MNTERENEDSAALVFVYGTLKRDHINHGQLRSCRYEGEALLTGLALYDLGPFPMAVASNRPDAVLQGELYAVGTSDLDRLDRFEGVPRLYERQRWPLSDGRRVWVYVGRQRQVRHVQRITSGRWQGRQQRPSAIRAMLPVLALLLATAPATLAADLRAQCLAWSVAHGDEQVRLGNQIGREQLLTKTHRLAEASADAAISLYSWSDLQRLCRRQ